MPRDDVLESVAMTPRECLARLAAIVPQPAAPLPAVPAPRAAASPLAWRHVRLGTDIADPLQRLQVLHVQALQGPDEVARALGSRALVEAGEQASAALLAWGRRLVVRAGARLGSRTPPANCTLAELPAPAQPMYLCGARLSYFSAILPISDGLGLAFAVTRYDGRVVISPTSCRELMPDPEAFAQCLRDSFQDYLALAQRPSPAPRPRPAVRRAKAAASARPAQALNGAAAPAVKAARPRASSAGRPRRASRPG